MTLAGAKYARNFTSKGASLSRILIQKICYKMQQQCNQYKCSLLHTRANTITDKRQDTTGNIGPTLNLKRKEIILTGYCKFSLKTNAITVNKLQCYCNYNTNSELLIDKFVYDIRFDFGSKT